MAFDITGNIIKDDRKVNFEEKMILEEFDTQMDLCAVIEHLGNQNFGHYICARRNFLMTQPFLSERDHQQPFFKYANWSLVSDESKFILLDCANVSFEQLSNFKGYIFLYQKNVKPISKMNEPDVDKDMMEMIQNTLKVE